MQPISNYCKSEVEGWEKLPESMVLTHPGLEKFSYGFLNLKEGIHFLASIKSEGLMEMCYVTIAPVFSLVPHKSKEELLEQIALEAGDIIHSFFKDSPIVTKFCKAPDTVRGAKNFFCILPKEFSNNN